MVKNNSINNEEISSTKNLNHQDLSEEIEIEKNSHMMCRTETIQQYPISVDFKEGSSQIIKQILWKT